ncbi:hypothetical protein J2S52_005110 [Streptomyces sp. DSM 41037]|nr:hypothetical protein [Streptomyces sp. DSM 41037]
MPWSDLLNRILAAATSGQGPDVLNIGNTWSSSLQATGALLPWGQRPRRRRLPAAPAPPGRRTHRGLGQVTPPARRTARRP